MPWAGETLFWLYLAAFVAVLAVCVGLHPASVLGTLSPVRAMSAGDVKSMSGAVRAFLIAVQFFLVGVLLVVVFVMYAQSVSLRETAMNPAGGPHVVIWSRLASAGVDHEILRSELMSDDSILSVTAVDVPPWGMAVLLAEFQRPAEQVVEPVTLQRRYVSHDYFQTLGIQLLAGRTFSSAYANDQAPPARPQAYANRTTPINIILDRAAAERLGWTDPQDAVGQTFFQNMPPRVPVEVVGVVENAPMQLIGYGHNAFSYFFSPQQASYAVVKVSSEQLGFALEKIDDVWERLAPDYPIRRQLAQEQFREAYGFLAAVSSTVVLLCAAALAIAGFGLFGMAAFVASMHKHEIAVRKALGASSEEVLAFLLWKFWKPVLLGNLLAWPVAYLAASAYLNMFVERISLTITPFFLSLILTFLLASGAIAREAISSARVSPADTLKFE